MLKLVHKYSPVQCTYKQITYLSIINLLKNLVFLSQKRNRMLGKNFMAYCGGKGVLYNFSCILRKIWYINYDEGVICATWNPTSALTEMESSFFYEKVLIYNYSFQSFLVQINIR